MSLSPQPNIILFMTDQQRFDSLGCYGVDFAVTPSLDRLAADGVRFEHCYVNNPICTPSRASLMTGHGLPTHGVHQLYGRLADRFVLFPEYLRELGYHTALVGKLHVSDYHIEAAERHPHDGFDEYHWCHDPTIALDSPYNGYAKWLGEKDPDYLAELAARRWGAPAPAHLHMTTWAAEQTIATIRERPVDKPLFCCMSVFDPHNPYHDCPEEYARRIDMGLMSAPVGLEENVATMPEGVRREHSNSYMGPWSKYSQEDIVAMRRGYHGSVSLIDEQVGHVLDELDRQGMTENTLVLFTSDHGDMLGDHQLLVKGAFFYDPCTRVPLLMRWPAGLPKGTLRSDLVQVNDLAATILGAAGMDAERLGKIMPESRNLLAGDDVREYATCLYLNTGISLGSKYFDPPIMAAMIRDDHYKLNVYRTESGPEEFQLFDMLADPDELHDLAAPSRQAGVVLQPDVASIIDRLRTALTPQFPQI